MYGVTSPYTFFGDLDRNHPTKFRMWPDRVVVVLPCGERKTDSDQRSEQRFVEAFLLQATIETSDNPVLHRLPAVM